MKKILLDRKVTSFSTIDLPMLIHGAEGNGASLFSVSVVTNLYAQGQKLLFMSSYHMARDEFKEQTGVGDEAVLIEGVSDIEQAHTKQVIFVPKEKAELFDRLITNLPDIAQRIIFLKNFDLFDEPHFAVIEKTDNLVLAGDLDNCVYKDRVLSKSWQSRIYFSSVENSDVSFPELPKYTGWLDSASRRGPVSVD